MDNSRLKRSRRTDLRLPQSVTKRKFSTMNDQTKNMDHLLCKICLQVYWEPFSTLCGHTFCRSCIEQHLSQNNRCPLCDTILDPKKARIIPNYTVAALVTKILLNDAAEFNAIQQKKNKTTNDAEVLLELILNANLDTASIYRISELIESKRAELEMSEEFLRNILIYEFLDKMIEKREKQTQCIQAQLERLRADKQKIVKYLSRNTMKHCRAFTTESAQIAHLQSQEQQQHCQQHNQRLVPDVAAAPPATAAVAPVDLCETSAGEISLDDSGPNTIASSSSSADGLTREAVDSTPAGVESIVRSSSIASSSTDFGALPLSKRVRDELAKYRKRLEKHVNSLEYVYFNSRQDEAGSTPVGSCAMLEIEDFAQVIRGMSQYGTMRRLATLNYNVEAVAPLSIVSSIEFDKDGEFFAVAGVTRLIKIYDFNLTVEFAGDNPYPIQQLQCNAKISNVSWNPYTKNLLASSDYDGTVQLWDTNVGRATRTLREHERRCWTVQFNNVDPHLMASGSDDSKVKLWNIMTPHSLCSIDVKANVCCVSFSPQSKNHLVFGSADHRVHLYDIRNPSKALSLFCGHRKAVSYVKYCNELEVVSASTDGDLRIWNINNFKCLRTLRGHQNERNFVGLATDGQHVMCGSENNHLYLYCKNISDPLMHFDFNSTKTDDTLIEPFESAGGVLPFDAGSTQSSSSSQSSTGSLNDFVSAICWKKNSNVIVAANSQGTTHILQLE